MLFETMMTTMNEVNRDKTKVPDFFFEMFRLSISLLNSMSKLIQCTCKLIIKSVQVYANEQLRLCFNVLSVILCCSALKLY